MMEMKNWEMQQELIVKKYLLLLQEVAMRYISIPMNISRPFLRISYRQNNNFLMVKLSEQNFETVGLTNKIILLCMK